MTVPADLVGAWRRSGLLLNGTRVVDYCDVIWLQTPEWFVDIRLLIDPGVVVPGGGVPDFFYAEFAFAGVASFDPPILTWDHRIDSSLEPAVDANPISWEDGVVFERGNATIGDTPCTYLEEWLKMTDDGVTWAADVDGSHARIEVGRFAVDIADGRASGGAFSATRYEQPGDGWTAVGSVRA
jgi:hypothetical protein